MKPYFSDGELTKKLKEIVILTDTREQVNSHVLEYFDKHKIKHMARALTTGDYTAMLCGDTFEHDVVIERKANLDEIAGNFTVGRQRFEDEFLRAKARGTKVHLIVENASWGGILAHNYRSKLKPQSLIASMLSWQARYNITVTFCRPSETGLIIYRTLYYWIRDALK